MPDLTVAFSKIFDATRLVALRDAREPLELLDADGDPVGIVDAGWVLDERSTGEGGRERVLELLLTDRDGLASLLADAERFALAGFVYERVGSVSPPAGNPALWTIEVKPVGRRA